MSALYVALLADGVADLIYTFISIKYKNKRLLIRKCISIVLGIAFMIFGTINMQQIKANEHTYETDKIDGDYTFVFLADLHVGSAQEFKTIEKAISDIKALNPDFIVLGGDITDDYTTKAEMEEAYALFKDFEKPVYYVYGNHDRQENASYANGRQYTVEELESTLTNNGIAILKDSFVSLNSDLMLLGRDDMSSKDRKNASELINPRPEDYYIVFDHQPFDEDGIKALGADLQVSGHTHGGQFFPLRVFYDWFIGDACGEYQHGNTTVLVSSGISGWRVPFRTDSHSYYEVIHLKKA